MKTGEVAIPDALVVAVFTPPANVPLAPLDGTVNVTVKPLNGLLKESFTVTCNCVANAVLMFALCGVPAEAVMLEGNPATPLAGLNAAITAPHESDTARAAPIEVAPAVVWI